MERGSVVSGSSKGLIRQVFILYRIAYQTGVHTIPDSLSDRCSYYTG